MEQEHEEKKKIKTYGRKRRRMQFSLMSFPPDLVLEILLKLPVKSIVRSRCVSKLWSSITTDSYFINLFETRSSPKSSLLIFLETKENTVVFSFPQHHQNSNETHQSYSIQPFNCFQMTYFPSESVHGLICFRTKFSKKGNQIPVIWNPTLRQFLYLTRPEEIITNFINVFLGYDPIEGKHKVLCMSDNEFCDECWILTLKSSSSAANYKEWRRIETNLHHRPFSCNGRCIDGVLYYKSHLDHKGNQVLMSFDVRTEKFRAITLPLDLDIQSEKDSVMIVYEGRFAFVNSDQVEDGKSIKLYVLENSKREEEWSEKSFRASFEPCHHFFEPKFKLSGVTDGCEFIFFVPRAFFKSFCIVYFDPKSGGSSRKVMFEGICNGNVDVIQTFPNHTFPNHIESLISF